MGGGTTQQYELNLQLHSQVSNPYTFNPKQNYKSSSNIKAVVPAYIEKSWTTPGTYTWTVPAGVTRVRVAVCGGGGGGNQIYEGTAGSGGISAIKNNTETIIQATGGSGGYVSFKDSDRIMGSGGVPNGRNGSYGAEQEPAQGGTGFALSFTLTNGTYGQGGSGTKSGILSLMSASGGSGGYNSNYINVNTNTTYSIIVGSGGSKLGDNGSNGNSGFVLIAYGEGIE